MIAFKRRSFWEEVKILLSPSYRAKESKATKEAIKYLIAHPDEPCIIGNYFIKDGYGSTPAYHDTLWE